jgi:hypothetical protein
MPRSGIPQFFHREIRHLIQSALEEAWQELKDEELADAKSVKERLATTIVALAAIGETDTAKLRNFALHAARATFSRRKRVSAKRQGAQIAAETFSTS